MTENLLREKRVSLCRFKIALLTGLNIVKYHDMKRAALIELIEEARTVLEKLLTLLQSAPLERDRFVLHHRREFRRTCETAGKSGKEIERSVIATFRIVESMAFKGEFRRWERSCGPGIEHIPAPQFQAALDCC